MTFKQRGFSLLEVMVALVVLGSALAAVVGMTFAQVRAEQRLQERFYAQMVAKNVLSEVKLETAFPALGERNGNVELGSRRWYWRLRILPTPSNDMRRMDIAVGLDPKVEASVVRLTSFAASGL